MLGVELFHERKRVMLNYKLIGGDIDHLADYNQDKCWSFLLQVVSFPNSTLKT